MRNLLRPFRISGGGSCAEGSGGSALWTWWPCLWSATLHPWRRGRWDWPTGARNRSECSCSSRELVWFQHQVAPPCNNIQNQPLQHLQHLNINDINRPLSGCCDCGCKARYRATLRCGIQRGRFASSERPVEWLSNRCPEWRSGPALENWLCVWSALAPPTFIFLCILEQNIPYSVVPGRKRNFRRPCALHRVPDTWYRRLCTLLGWCRWWGFAVLEKRRVCPSIRAACLWGPWPPSSRTWRLRECPLYRSRRRFAVLPEVSLEPGISLYPAGTICRSCTWPQQRWMFCLQKSNTITGWYVIMIN